MFSRLRSDIQCILDRDPAARSGWEVLTCYPGLHALVWHRGAHWCWTHGLKWLGRFISNIGRWLTGIEIHPGAQISGGVFIDHGMGVVIGETAEIGEGCTIYHGVTLGGTSWSAGKRHPTLGNQVVVGAGAKILGPIAVGNRARIAANSVVIEEVPAGATVVGIPGRVVAPRRATTHGFDLDHHLIPDPVGKAIACLLDRVAQLERQLPAQAQAEVMSTPATACGACNDHCSEPGFDQPFPQPSTME